MRKQRLRQRHLSPRKSARKLGGICNASGHCDSGWGAESCARRIMATDTAEYVDALTPLYLPTSPLLRLTNANRMMLFLLNRYTLYQMNIALPYSNKPGLR